MKDVEQRITLIFIAFGYSIVSFILELMIRYIDRTNPTPMKLKAKRKVSHYLALFVLFMCLMLIRSYLPSEEQSKTGSQFHPLNLVLSYHTVGLYFDKRNLLGGAFVDPMSVLKINQAGFITCYSSTIMGSHLLYRNKEKIIKAAPRIYVPNRRLIVHCSLKEVAIGLFSLVTHVFVYKNVGKSHVSVIAVHCQGKLQ